MRILRVLRSRVLSCGCLVGVYETYDGPVVEFVDQHNPHCCDGAHVAGRSAGVIADATDRELYVAAGGQGNARGAARPT